jgi:hypothetical protein
MMLDDFAGVWRSRVAWKRRGVDSRYEPKQRWGVWLKMRVESGQEFVTGGTRSAIRSTR